MSLRRRIALWICPELRSQARVSAASSRDQVLIALADQYRAACDVSDWGIAERAGVNNRAIMLLRDGKTVRTETASSLFEFFRANRKLLKVWPVTPEDEKRFFQVDCIP